MDKEVTDRYLILELFYTNHLNYDRNKKFTNREEVLYVFSHKISRIRCSLIIDELVREGFLSEQIIPIFITKVGINEVLRIRREIAKENEKISMEDQIRAYTVANLSLTNKKLKNEWWKIPLGVVIGFFLNILYELIKKKYL